MARITRGPSPTKGEICQRDISPRRNGASLLSTDSTTPIATDQAAREIGVFGLTLRRADNHSLD
jgi:hypothetical protein